jgi:CRISPR-associated protein Cmr3
MTIEISPLDTLFFKNPKPFNAGDESWSDGIFPPTPSTIYGALRSIYFRNNPHELEKANTKDDPTKELKIRKIYLKISQNYYFPLPLDIVKDKDKEKDFYLLNIEKRNILSNLSLKNLLIIDKNIERVENFYIEKNSFLDYIENIENSFTLGNNIENISNYLKDEPKIGIKIDKSTKTVEEGYLYRIDLKRLDRAKIVVEFEGLKIDSKLIKLGGEGKMATINYIEDLEIITPPNLNKIFKLYFLTPAIFDKGWLPKWIDKDSLEGEYKGLKLKLLTASIGKYKLIGGFDMKENRPKPMYRAVSEGSVYYFELLNGDKEKVIELLHNQAISDKLANEGYGITFIGEVK